MKPLLSRFASLALMAVANLPARAQAAAVSVHNLVWTTPSTDATGSMPLSGGILGLNVWVEGDDLLFYIGHPDSRMEDQKLVKLRVTVAIPASLAVDGRLFTRLRTNVP